MCCQSLLYLRILNVLISDSNEYSLHKREATFTCSQGKDLAPWRSKMVFKSSTKPCREDSHFKPPSNPFRINCSFSYCQSLSGGQVGLCFAIQIAQKIGRQLFHVQKLLRIVRWVLLQRLSWLPCIFLQSELRKYKEKLQSQVTRNFPGRTWLLPLWPQVLAAALFGRCVVKCWKLPKAVFTLKYLLAKRICAVLIHIVLVWGLCVCTCLCASLFIQWEYLIMFISYPFSENCSDWQDVQNSTPRPRTWLPFDYIQFNQPCVQLRANLQQTVHWIRWNFEKKNPESLTSGGGKGGCICCHIETSKYATIQVCILTHQQW